jgi:hypothetical protein
MFLVLPAVIRVGWSFWPALGAGVAPTVVLYLLAAAIAVRRHALTLGKKA